MTLLMNNEADEKALTRADTVTATQNV